MKQTNMHLLRCWKTAGDAKDEREMWAANSTNIFQLRIRRVVFFDKSAWTPFTSAVTYEVMLTNWRAAITFASYSFHWRKNLDGSSNNVSTRVVILLNGICFIHTCKWGGVRRIAIIVESSYEKKEGYLEQIDTFCFFSELCWMCSCHESDKTRLWNINIWI